MTLAPALLPAALTGKDLDLRLVAVDMDGTLLDDDHRPHPTLVPLLAELRRRGIAFCPASGRQYATLARQFPADDGAAGTGAEADSGLFFIAENGAYVRHGDSEVQAQVLAPDLVVDLVLEVRRLAAAGADVGVVVCGKRSAYVERADPAFRAEADRYYARLAGVPTLLTEPGPDGREHLAVDDDVLKVAVFDFADAATSTAPALEAFAPTHQVVVSGRHWVDVLGRTTHKGAALRAVQERLGVTPAQTVVFGDYLNDLTMLDAAELSFAMANAHPQVLARARYVAPANTENGVVRVLAALLGLEMSELARAAPSAG